MSRKNCLNQLQRSIRNKNIDLWNGWVVEKFILKLRDASEEANWFIDLTNLEINNEIINHIFLYGALLNTARLHKINMNYSCLVRTHFKGTYLEEVSFQNSDLRGAVFENVNLKNVNFQNSDLRGAVFENADLKNVNLRKADLRGANLNNTDLSNVDMRYTRFEQIYETIEHSNPTTQKHTKILEIQLGDLWRKFTKDDNFGQSSSVQLQNANLKKARLQNATFTYCDLRYVDFSEAYLHKVNFQQTNLSEARFRKAILWKTDFRKSTVYKTDFRNAQAHNANIQELELKETNLLGTKGIKFNNNDIRSAKTSSLTTGPWLTLERKYTNTMLLFNLLGVIIFFLPYTFSIFTWRSVNFIQSTTQDTKEGIYTIAMALDTEAHPLAELAQKMSYQIHHSTPCLAERCKEWSIWQLLLGFHRAWQWGWGNMGVWFYGSVGLLLVIYNALRLHITQRVSVMKDEKRVDLVTPGWDNYKDLYWIHRYFLRYIFWLAVISALLHSLTWLFDPVFLPTKR